MESELAPEQPCYALFGHRSEGPSTREVVLAIRGTQTVQDVVTDIRAAPTQFPPAAAEVQSCLRGEPVSATAEGSNRCAGAVDDVGDGAINGKLRNNKRKQWEWLNVPKHRTYACGGMLRSALHVLREVGPSLVRLHREGFQVTLVGHSLGGAVAALMTYLLKYGGYSDGSGGENISIPDVQGFTYGCPSCVDAETSDILRSNVVSVVVGDDVISRITPQSIRLLLRELMVFREQMFRHLQQDWEDVMRRAAELWSPRQRDAPPMFNREVEAESLINLKDDRSLRYDPTYTSESEGQRDPSANDDEAIVVEEESLKALWLPGRVLHLYRHRGQWRGAEVSRDFPLLRFVSVQSNMFEDHCSEQITNALLEMRTARRLSQQQSGRCALPAWTPFDHSNACVCCNNSFTWHSTFRGEAQEFRDRNNCHFCGRLVCGPCSMQSRSMPQFGFIFPRRICDQCVMKGDFASPS